MAVIGEMRAVGTGTTANTFPSGATIAFGYMAVGPQPDSYRKLIEVSFSGERAHRGKNAQDSSLRSATVLEIKCGRRIPGALIAEHGVENDTARLQPPPTPLLSNERSREHRERG
jgi:hypothetical protein